MAMIRIEGQSSDVTFYMHCLIEFLLSLLSVKGQAVPDLVFI